MSDVTCLSCETALNDQLEAPYAKSRAVFLKLDKRRKQVYCPDFGTSQTALRVGGSQLCSVSENHVRLSKNISAGETGPASSTQVMEEAERVVQELDRADAHRAAATAPLAADNSLRAAVFELANKVLPSNVNPFDLIKRHQLRMMPSDGWT